MIKILKAYINYFIQYPGIYELFFLERTGMGIKKNTVQVIFTLLDNLCKEQWASCIKNSHFNSIQVIFIKEQLKYSVTGLLLFYINRKHPETYNDFILLCEKQINYMLK